MHRIDHEGSAGHGGADGPSADDCSLWLAPHGRIQRLTDQARGWLASPDAGLVVGRYGALEAPQAPALLSTLYDRARVEGHSLTALGRVHRLPVTLCCRRIDGGLKLVVHAPELVIVDAGVLQAVFQLTRTEAQVAALLCDGLSSTQIAAQLGVQPNTVLTHIKRCLAKTGCIRQVQLVSLLQRSVARRSRPLACHPPIPGELVAARAPPYLIG